MSKLPAIQFYPGDWRKDPGVQSLSFHDRGVWFEILLLMHESDARGKLILNGKPMPTEALGRLLGLDNQILTTTLTKLLEYGVASKCEESGVISCRRMVRDEELRQVRKTCGKLGGNPKLVNQKPTTVVNQNPTPSSSSSSSSSVLTTEGTPERKLEHLIPKKLDDAECHAAAEKWFAYLASKGLEDKSPAGNEIALEEWWRQMAKFTRAEFLEAVSESIAACRWNVTKNRAAINGNGKPSSAYPEEFMLICSTSQQYRDDIPKRKEILGPRLFSIAKRLGITNILEAIGNDWKMKSLVQFYNQYASEVEAA